MILTTQGPLRVSSVMRMERLRIRADELLPVAVLEVRDLGRLVDPGNRIIRLRSQCYESVRNSRIELKMGGVVEQHLLLLLASCG
jgi:hypothetical protein